MRQNFDEMTNELNSVYTSRYEYQTVNQVAKEEFQVELKKECNSSKRKMTKCQKNLPPHILISPNIRR